MQKADITQKDHITASTYLQSEATKGAILRTTSLSHAHLVFSRANLSFSI